MALSQLLEVRRKEDKEKTSSKHSSRLQKARWYQDEQATDKRRRGELKSSVTNVLPVKWSKHRKKYEN